MKKIYALLLLIISVFAGENLTGIACRSVHLGYQYPPSEEAEITVIPRQTAPGTYFCALGFEMGYFGIQEVFGGKKVVIFSVWDPAGEGDQINPNSVAKEKQAQVLYSAPECKVSRFGHEGTGLKCMMDYNWELNKPYKFKVVCKPEENNTIFEAFFYMPEKKEWLKIATYRTVTGGIKLHGLYSFVEDFHRNRVSTKQIRKAEFGDMTLKIGDKTVVVDKAMFSADGNLAKNIDSGVASEKFFFLATGGDIKNENTQLWKFSELKNFKPTLINVPKDEKKLTSPAPSKL